MPQSSKVTPPAKGGSPLPILFLLITVGILAAGGYFVYKTVNKDGSSLSLPGNPLGKIAEIAGGNSIPQVTENDFKDISDPLIRKHFAAQANTRTFKITSDSSGRGEKSVTDIVMTSQTDFRMHTQMATTDMITIGDTTYIKDPKDGAWWFEKAKPVPTGEVATTPEAVPSPEDFKSDYLKKTTMTYKSLGQEACPGASGTGLTCYKYEESDSTNADSGKRTFWFDTKDFLLRREISGYGEFSATNDYSYTNVSVNVPSPTKPVPEGKSIYEMMAVGLGAPQGQMPAISPGAGMPSQDQINAMMKQFGQQPDTSAPPQPTDAPADSSNNSGY